jgi:hypothetical protein
MPSLGLLISFVLPGDFGLTGQYYKYDGLVMGRIGTVGHLAPGTSRSTLALHPIGLF